MEQQLTFLAIFGGAFLTVYVVFLINREHYRHSFEQCWKGDGLPAFLILVMLYLFIAYGSGALLLNRLPLHTKETKSSEISHECR